MDSQNCPTDELLEEIARDGFNDAADERHIAQCQICTQRLEEIRTNNNFLELIAQAVPENGLDLKSDHGVAHSDSPLPEILPGGYRVDGEIHRGGHGIIYRATQLRTNRPVAVKMLISGTLATPRQRVRFEQEAEIVAGLNHPGIVTIYDAGYLEDGRFGFAMEFVEGVTLDRWSEGHKIAGKEDIGERLRIFLAICDAVHFAHQNGVVHRDLKPANILIDHSDDPHILDFGIAKVLDDENHHGVKFGDMGVGEFKRGSFHHTIPGEFAGTLMYASPEQVSGDPSAIDMRTDVYSLGVILYEFLTGELPYPIGSTIEEAIDRIAHCKPASPASHSSCIERDLSEIVLTALRKDKHERYTSVHDFGRDIKSYLDGRPIEIRRDSAWYVIHKTARRHWLASSVVLGAFAILAAFGVSMSVLYVQKTIAETNAVLQLRQTDLALAHTEGIVGDGVLAIDMLWRAQLESINGMPAPKKVLFGSAFEPLDSYWELWGFYSRNPCLRSTEFFGGSRGASAVRADGRLLAVLGDGTLSVLSLPDLKQIREMEVELSDGFAWRNDFMQMVFSHDGQSVTVLGKAFVVRFDIENGKLLGINPTEFAVHQRHLFCFNSDIFVATVKGTSIEIFRSTDPSEIITLDCGDGQKAMVNWNPSGSLLATSTIKKLDYAKNQSTLSIWSMPSGELVARIACDGGITGMLFTPGDRSVMLFNPHDTKRMSWEIYSNTTPNHLRDAPRLLTPMYWLNHGALLASVDPEYTVSVIETKSEIQTSNLIGHASPVQSIYEYPDESILLSLSEATARVWTIDPQLWEPLSSSSDIGSHEVAFSKDGRFLAWANSEAQDYRVTIIDLEQNKTQLELRGHQDLITSISIGQEGNQMVSAGIDGQVCLWDLTTGQLLDEFRDHESGVHGVALSPTANYIASGGNDSFVVLRNLDTGLVRVLEGHTSRVPRVAFHPSGKTLASCSLDGTVRLWDVQTGELIKVIEFEGGIHALCFSPDGFMLAAGGVHQDITIIDLKRDERSTLQGDSSAIFSLAFGPEGRVLVSGDKAGNLNLWDTQSARRLLRFPKHRELMMSIAISPDGRTMVTSNAGTNPEIRIWDLAAFAPHIAGNLELYGQRLERELHKKPANLDAMRRWAAEVRGDSK